MTRLLLAFGAALTLSACEEAAMAAFNASASGEEAAAAAPPPIPLPEPQPVFQEDGTPLPARPEIGVVTAMAPASLPIPIAEQLSGRSISGPGLALSFRRDGTLTGARRDGTQFEAVWTVRDESSLCWTVTLEGGAAGETTCKQITVVLDQVTLFGGGMDLQTFRFN